jgi:hypothetical protein
VLGAKKNVKAPEEAWNLPAELSPQTFSVENESQIMCHVLTYHAKTLMAALSCIEEAKT